MKTGMAMIGRTVPGQSGNLACWMCNKSGHFAADCPDQAEFAAKGWLVKGNDGKFVLKGGGWLPRSNPEDKESRATKIRNIARERNWPGAHGEDPSANMFSIEDVAESYMQEEPFDETLSLLKEQLSPEMYQTVLESMRESKN
jgi:hypothetical protein